ncbi:MAG: hypothetical protein ACREES_06910 [Stellaceae bacterium]
MSQLDKEALDAIEGVISNALSTPEGSAKIVHACNYLEHEMTRHHFNTERAFEVFSIAVDNAVWANVKDRDVYAIYKQSRLGPQMAKALTEQFIARTGAKDQRPTKRWFRGFLGS